MVPFVFAHSWIPRLGDYSIEATAGNVAGRDRLLTNPRVWTEDARGALNIDHGIMRFIDLPFHITPSHIVARLFQLIESTLKAIFSDSKFRCETLPPSNPVSYSHDDSPCERYETRAAGNVRCIM